MAKKSKQPRPDFSKQQREAVKNWEGHPYTVKYDRGVSIIMIACVGLFGVLMLLCVLALCFGVSVFDFLKDWSLFGLIAVFAVVAAALCAAINVWGLFVDGDELIFRDHFGRKTTFTFSDVQKATEERKRGNQTITLYVVGMKPIAINENMQNRATFAQDLRRRKLLK